MAEIGKLSLVLNTVLHNQYQPTAIAECHNDDAYDVEKV